MLVSICFTILHCRYLSEENTVLVPFPRIDNNKIYMHIGMAQHINVHVTKTKCPGYTLMRPSQRITVSLFPWNKSICFPVPKYQILIFYIPCSPKLPFLPVPLVFRHLFPCFPEINALVSPFSKTPGPLWGPHYWITIKHHLAESNIEMKAIFKHFTWK